MTKEMVKMAFKARYRLVLALALTGCAQGFTAKTSVSVSVSPDGSCQATYTSDKEQVGLEAEVCGGKVKVDKSGTLESVVAATAASQAELIKMLNKLTDLIPAAAKAGVLAGS